MANSTHGRAATILPTQATPSLRAELFGVEQLSRHARDVANGHRIVAGLGSDLLLDRLSQNENILRSFNRATLELDPGRRIAPAAEWLLDNFYLIETQIQMARRHLPRGYSRELPRLSKGDSTSLPRVYDIVLELISHVDAQIDAGSLGKFVAAYQSVHSLKLGELWAIPIMLRLGLIENLRRVTTRLTVARHDRDRANHWVNKFREKVEENPSQLIVLVADMAKSDLSLSSAFVAEFCQCLSRQSPELHLARSWLEQRLVSQGQSIEQLVRQENQVQAADQVSVSHCIGSLRFLSDMNWKNFVESMSVVEETLRADPAGVYLAMDFATRDRYRHAVEFFSRHSKYTEAEIAERAIRLATDGARDHGVEHRSAHIGFYLIDKGHAVLGRTVHVRWPWRTSVERAIRRLPLTYYAGGIVAIAALSTCATVFSVKRLGIQGLPLFWLGLVFFLCFSQLAVAVMNWLSMLLVKPRLLPRLDFAAGIQADCRTLVVVPTMLTNLAGIDRLIESLEIHYLSNRDSRLHFSLLTDFRDAVAETMPEDSALLQHVSAGIDMLNRKYPMGESSRFFLLHRPRHWNPGEGIWMGYERKRGKLLDLNAFLRGGPRDVFSEIAGVPAIIPDIKYVITLDTDTQIPRDAARELVAAMAHPLNRPVFEAARGIVTAGYGIMQPRIGVSLASAWRSRFARLFAGDAGIDPYTREVSDVYQDVFQEGSFFGKGIYDVDVFQQALNGRFPANAVLSHDLLEACHARSALICDVEFYEDFPSRYNVDMDRRHRWIRGDWQILPWLLPRVSGFDARRTANPLSAISRWKIFDNLRRSLVPAAMVLAIVGVWLLLPEFAGLGLLLVLLILSVPGLLAAAVAIFRKPNELPWSIYLRVGAGTGGKQMGRILLAIAFLPYEAYVNVDAILKTSLRMLITHKRLLEWQTSSDCERTQPANLKSIYVKMAISPAIAVVVGCVVAANSMVAFYVFLPILGLWVAAPLIAWWVSLPTKLAKPKLSVDQERFLRCIARRTWHFFETFVTAEEHWLPPDNFQDYAAPRVASRTSPTNIGLGLLAHLAARDFGYLSLGGLIRRTESTLATMTRLERYRGHFFNWYETRTLNPMLPRYISSVDSGNLAGHLLTLGAGLREQADEKIFSPAVFSGIRDTVHVLLDLAQDDRLLTQIAAALETVPGDLRGALALLKTVGGLATAFANSVESENIEILGWAETLRKNCDDHYQDLLFIAPWLVFEQAPEAAFAMRDRIPSLREVAALAKSSDFSKAPQCVKDAGMRAGQRLRELEKLATQCDEFAAMDFSFLFDNAKNLFSIGYNVGERQCDPSFYDLLASEARLCSYIAIAQGQVHQDHWFTLGRMLVASHGVPVLVSWSGSMFEYLMPLLVMPNYENTLFDRTYTAAVRQQIAYGKLRGVPWGISESGYNRTDFHHDYQYRAFGVPGLALKRGLADDLVVAPYATALALMVMPEEACANLQRLADDGRVGAYGFYEAVDYTPTRLPPDETSVTVRSFMAHHQAIHLLSLVNLLHDFPMQRRFMACPALKALELLLQERVPKTGVSSFVADLTPELSHTTSGEVEGTSRTFTNPTPPLPEVHLLSNGRYHVVVTSSGGGYSRWRDLAVTRWQEDATQDCWGTFIYLRDVETGALWSSAYQPTLRPTQSYEAIFTQARAEFRQQHIGLDIHTEICVSPEDDMEFRRVTIANRTTAVRVVELTSYAEAVLAPAATDAAHPAFSKLFLQTEFLQESSALLCSRRARSKDEKTPWLLHLMLGQEAEHGSISCETDRGRFIGRGGSLVNPAAMRDLLPLSNTCGSVLDPIVSLRRRITLQPYQVVTVDFMLGVSETRESALAQVEKYQNPRMADRAFDLAWTHSQATLHHIDATAAEANLFGRLAGALVYVDPRRRASASMQRNNRRGQSGLWSYGISGDAPLVVLHVGDAGKIDIVRQAVRAHSYWRLKGLTVDMIILTDDITVYRESLQDQITSLISSGFEAQMLDKPGGIFVRRSDQISIDDRTLLQASARIVLDDDKGTLAEQWDDRGRSDVVVPDFVPSRASSETVVSKPPPRDLSFANGLGGFSRDGREYVITLEAGQTTPAPWVNVIANPFFGTVVSESGSAYTWVENAHEFRLTPWRNDPVCDPTGEALYIRDEETGEYWSPTPLPARGKTPYVVRHGFGYTVFEHREHGIASELWVYVAIDAPVKFSVLKIANVSGRPRRLSVTGYWEWVLGEIRQKSLLHVQTEVDLKTGALLVRNLYNSEFSERIGFVDVNDPERTLSGDRKEFLGRNGNMAKPAAMKRSCLSGKVGAGLDPCGAVQVTFDLANGQERETIFRLGIGRNPADVQNLIQRFRHSEDCRVTLDVVHDYWRQTLGAIAVETPDPAVNILANGWLLYQTLSSRLWGRTGFYQSGGAYGFRDQLQDTMSLVHAEPALIREHLLRAAAQQFREGDVQHWWHPPAGRGVRTRFSDDYLWLPYAVCRYVTSVADTGVLDEPVPFLEGRPVKPEEESYYDLPVRSEDSATLYAHCKLAIEFGLKFGSHGLPLMGSGDWNDGMNLVGKDGRGESVWLAFFLYDVLGQFSKLARARQDEAFADLCEEEARRLQANIERHGWDGQWYRRAYFDNGEPLGSAGNLECQIDALPQIWSVISGAGDPERCRLALAAVDRRLVRADARLIQLFDPPFDRTAQDPGYVKGYIPGVRENGGQFTHSAIWTVMAFAMAGDPERAWELLALINPIHHGGTPDRMAVYKVEPYVIASDVYAVTPHLGRGGWTWYTGSAGWFYRVLVETLLGIAREGASLRLEPKLPKAWRNCTVRYRYRKTVYNINITQLEADSTMTGRVMLDGTEIASTCIPLVDDGQEHIVEVRLCSR